MEIQLTEKIINILNCNLENCIGVSTKRITKIIVLSIEFLASLLNFLLLLFSFFFLVTNDDHGVVNHNR